MSIGDGINTYSDSTLKSLNKDNLIEFIRVLEKNCRVHLETIENQAKFLKTIIENSDSDNDSMTKEVLNDILNDFLEPYDVKKYTTQKQVIAKAINAVDKQIPKKVRKEEGDWWYCPTCGECLNNDYNHEAKYCEDCGQKLDWD